MRHNAALADHVNHKSAAKWESDPCSRYLDQAREALPLEARTAENIDALAMAIMRTAKRGERNPTRLLIHALKAIASEAAHGVI